jgi:hypothetical protein
VIECLKIDGEMFGPGLGQSSVFSRGLHHDLASAFASGCDLRIGSRAALDVFAKIEREIVGSKCEFFSGKTSFWGREFPRSYRAQIEPPSRRDAEPEKTYQEARNARASHFLCLVLNV